MAHHLPMRALYECYPNAHDAKLLILPMVKEEKKNIDDIDCVNLMGPYSGLQRNKISAVILKLQLEKNETWSNIIIQSVLN